MKTETNFKVGYLKTLENIETEIEQEPHTTSIFIESKDSDGNTYSWSMICQLTLKKFFDFELNRRIDFMPYLIEGDNILGINGKYDVCVPFKITMMRYLPHNFIFDISFKDIDDLVGNIELDIKIPQE